MNAREYVWRCDTCNGGWSQHFVNTFHGGSVQSLENEHNKLRPGHVWHTIKHESEIEVEWLKQRGRF